MAGPVWVEIRRADLLVLLAVAHAALERVTLERPLPERTWELAQAVEAAEAGVAGTVRARSSAVKSALRWLL